ncbi:PREDICTED: ankyrin repeat domain-containing protein 26-like [Miniopterus natalensis]|uniref:ankyrin repeat domain-containing protein 26-like n=1 Tax=Miniopterus natalensis TaxID=291302 RepID=UPI0007A6A7C3|nr:PREDICTED: ankyrin repeat domain-containing protein 26-like [Miniopterus natalensis]
MPSNLTNKILDCGGKDSFGMPLSEVFQTFPLGEKPTLKNVFPSHSRSGPPEDSPWSSSSELCLTEKKLHSENDHKPDTEHVLNKNEEPFCSDTENIKGRNPVVTSKVKEDQEFDMQMTKNMNPNTTNRKLGVRHTPQPSGLKSHLDLQIASHSEKNHMIQIKRHDTYAVTSTYKETKPNQDLLQKPLYADHCSASNYKGMESEIQEWSSSDPYSVRTPTGCETEALEQDVQRLNMDMSKAELPALRKRGRSSSDNLSVSDRYEKEESLLPEIHKLQDEIAALRMEIDAVKNQNREMEKKCLKDIAIAKEKNDHLQKTIKLNEETLTKTIFQYHGQLEALTAQNAMLNSELENEKQNRERLEAEVESYRPRLATALQDREQCQTSKKDLQLAFQRIRDEWFCFQDKMNFDMSDLKKSNEILSQQLSKPESKFSSLEIELHHTRDAPRERTLILEGAEGDLSKTKGQKTETEHVYQSEQCKVNKYTAEQESLREKLCQLQSENMLLRQQLDDAHSKADSEEKTVVNILDQLQEMRKIFHAKQDQKKELTNEWHHLKERIYKYENDKAERHAIVRQLQQDLADTKNKLSTLEASQKVESPSRMNLEDEKKKLKQELDESRSQIQHEKKHIRKWAELKSPLQSCLREVLKKTGELEKELTR